MTDAWALAKPVCDEHFAFMLHPVHDTTQMAIREAVKDRDTQWQALLDASEAARNNLAEKYECNTAIMHARTTAYEETLKRAEKAEAEVARLQRLLDLEKTRGCLASPGILTPRQ